MLYQSHNYKFPVLSTPWCFNRQETISTHPINSLKATEMWLLLSRNPHCRSPKPAYTWIQPWPNETSAALMTNSGPAHQRKRGATVSLRNKAPVALTVTGAQEASTQARVCLRMASSILKEQVWQCPANIKESQWSVLKQRQRPSIASPVSSTGSVFSTSRRHETCPGNRLK